METRTTVRSWRALAFAGVILGGTCFILFQDVLEGARITTGHVLTAMALLIATAAGHQIAPTVRAHRYALSASMVILAVGAILYVGLMSGARNAEFTANKADRIEETNKERERIGKLRDQAQAMLNVALAEVAKECASGKGTKCEGRKATRDVYEAALKGHHAELAKLGTAQTANAGYKAIAEGIVLLPWFSHYTIPQIVHALIILLPWLAVVLSELSVPTFLSLAIGHTCVPTFADSAQTSFPPPGGGGKRRRKVAQLSAHEKPRQLPANVISIADNRKDIVAVLKASGRPMTVSELARAMNVTRGEASRRWREAGNRVAAKRHGKFVVISLRTQAAA